jgi:hypothetical protein
LRYCSFRLGSTLSSEKFVTKFNAVGKEVWDAWDEHLEKQYQGNFYFLHTHITTFSDKRTQQPPKLMRKMRKMRTECHPLTRVSHGPYNAVMMAGPYSHPSNTSHFLKSRALFAHF